MATESIPLKASQLEAVLTSNILAGEPVCVSGPPGAGKTDIGTKAAANARTELMLVHPVTSEPTDAKGLPVMTVEGAEFSPYGWLRRMQHQPIDKPLTVFIDDFGHAPQAVQASLMQIMHARQVNEVRISDAVRFICATNRKSDKGSGVTSMIDPLKKRMLMLEFKPDLGEWQQWGAANGINSKVIAYLSLMNEYFIQEAETNTMLVSACPRGWHRVSRQLALAHSTDVLPAVFAGCVGPEPGAGFAGFLRVYDNLVMPAVVWANPERAPIPADPSALWALVSALAAQVTPTTVGATCKYLLRLIDNHREHAMLCVKLMVARDPTLQAGPDFIAAAQGPLGRLMMGVR